MEEVYSYLIEFGFTKEEVDEIFNNYSISAFVPATLLKHIKNISDYLLELGYTKLQIIKI